MRSYIAVFAVLAIFATVLGAETAVPKTDRIAVPFVITRTGHILVTVKINDKDANFVVDTAAGVSVIHTKQIKTLDLKASKGNAQVTGLGTASYVMKNVNVPTMTIGGIEYQKPFFVALDLSHVELATGNKDLHGLLGSTFLQKYAAIINYEAKTISLKHPLQTNNSKANKPNALDKK